MALDADTALIPHAHWKRQGVERETVGVKWVETGLVFTEEDSGPLHPRRRH